MKLETWSIDLGNYCLDTLLSFSDILPLSKPIPSSSVISKTGLQYLILKEHNYG